MDSYSAHFDDLERLKQAGRLRSLIGRNGVDFASNDYLGLAQSNELRTAAMAAIGEGVAVGSGGSRLLRGNCPEHNTLESEAAQFFGSEAALFFATGYMANLALLSALPQKGDLLLYDELVHASSHDGMKMGRAQVAAFSHSDVAAAGRLIEEWRANGGRGQVWIAVESLYSMDGDFAPLADLTDLADRLGAILIIDEAHATGIFGENGEGLAGTLHRKSNVITLHTLGKAFGCEGALVCGPEVVREFLINRARSFIFSTAPSPLTARVALEAIRLVQRQPERRERLRDLIEYAGRKFGMLGIQPSGSQIIPVIVGDDLRTMQIARAVQDAGYDVRGIRPPTVPEGTSRLRISLTLNANASDIDGLAQILEEQFCPSL